MALSADVVVSAALTVLRENGLASLSMRQLAGALGVQPGALYWHVKSKQDLLALVAERILDGTELDQPAAPLTTRLIQQTCAVRTALLAVRDGAEVVSFAQALDPRDGRPMRTFHDTLPAQLPDPHAEWGARTITHYLLGEVAEEQNHAELVRAGIVADQDRFAYSTETFLFGIKAILDGLNLDR